MNDASAWSFYSRGVVEIPGSRARAGFPNKTYSGNRSIYCRWDGYPLMSGLPSH